jgi:hypothetical protein
MFVSAAGGHVNRANRPNTWLHRPAKRRGDSPCQLGAVHTWHNCELREERTEFRLREQSGSDVFDVGLHALSNFRLRVRVHHYPGLRVELSEAEAQRKSEVSDLPAFSIRKRRLVNEDTSDDPRFLATSVQQSEMEATQQISAVNRAVLQNVL